MTDQTDQLPALAVIAFSGREAGAFLNGQLTVSAAGAGALPAGQWRRAAYCSRQGRMIASGILAHLPAAEEEEIFYFIVSADLAEAVAAMLRRFVLRAKVTIETPAAPVAAALAEPLPAAAGGGEVSVRDGIAEIDEGGGQCLRVNAAPAPSEESGGRAAAAGWHAGEIKRGIAWISAAVQDKIIPQFANFELLGGVDFEKGCFVGQEVIARLHHLGEVKRRGMIIRGSGPAAAGDELKTADGKAAGDIINAAGDGEGFIAFAAVVKSAAAAGALFVNGSEVTAAPPPYPIVEHEKFKRR